MFLTSIGHIIKAIKKKDAEALGEGVGWLLLSSFGLYVKLYG
jgi:hypothetical protein